MAEQPLAGNNTVTQDLETELYEKLANFSDEGLDRMEDCLKSLVNIIGKIKAFQAD